MREAANRAQCQNNLKQMGIAFHNLHDTYRHFPSDGWGWSWVGEPDRGPDQSQPGGWIYQIMTFMEQGNLQKQGAGLPRDQQLALNYTMCPIVIPMLNCPSRRTGGPWPNSWPTSYYNCAGRAHSHRKRRLNWRVPITRPTWVGKSWPMALQSVALMIRKALARPPLRRVTPPNLTSGTRLRTTTSIPARMYCRSQTRITDITGGTSNVYLVGEKYLNPTDYFTGQDPSDNECMYIGTDNDTEKFTYDPTFSCTPIQDKRGYQNTEIFGSATSGDAI